MLFEVRFSTLIVVVGLVLVASVPVLATTMVAIRTPDTVVLAADSRGTFAGGRETTRNVCKIYRVSDRFFAVAGLSEDPGRGFSAVTIVSRAIQGSDGVMNAVINAAEAMKDPLKIELTRLAAEDKGLLERSLGKLPSVVVIGAEKGLPAAAGFHFEIQGNNRWPAELNLRTLRCPGDCQNGVYTFFLGERSAIDRYVADYGRALAMSPEDGAQFLVKLEIEAGTPGVGGPVDAVRVSSSGAEWLSVKPECR
jgi:proteasome subunit B (beta)-like protein